MSAGAWWMAVVVVITAGAVLFLIQATYRSIVDFRAPGRSVWREFGLGLILMILFLATWIGHGIAQWQMYTDEQQTHGESTEVGNFVAEFMQATLENWQSEFLQLFSFVTLAALYIHKGSAESKDSDEKMEASLRRIEEHLGTLPPGSTEPNQDDWQLPDTPLQAQD